MVSNYWRNTLTALVYRDHLVYQSRNVLIQMPAEPGISCFACIVMSQRDQPIEIGNAMGIGRNHVLILFVRATVMIGIQILTILLMAVLFLYQFTI